MKKLIVIFIFTGCFYFKNFIEEPEILRFGEYFEYKNLKIKFKDVLNDERCPENTECKWEGKIELLFEIIKNKDTSYLKVRKIKGREKRIYFEKFIFIILKVLPLRKSFSETIKKEKYEILYKIKDITN